jgi:Uncharacterized protein conserved in bacteria
MLITLIERQKKKRGRYNVFLDDEFAFGASEDTLMKFGLRKNDNLSDETVEKIKDYDELSVAKDKAIKFLAYKSRTEKELRTKLKSLKISESNIRKVIDLMIHLKYLDDASYVKTYLENNLSNKPAGKRMLRIKLAQKGIGKELIDEVLEEKYDEETETEKARELFVKYSKKVRGKTDYDKKRKCFQYMLSRGFDYDIVKSVVNANDDDE